MRGKTFVLAMLLTLLGVATLAQADTLRLRSGQALQGSLVGASTREIRFMGSDGRVRAYPIGQVEFIAFSAPAPKPAHKAAPAPAAVTIPAGTVISVRLIDNINVDATAAGEAFRASVDDPVIIGGEVVIPRGANALLQVAKVEQSGKFKGSDKITLKLNSIAVRGREYQVVSGYVESKGKGEGKKTTRKVLGGAGLGAAIGAIAGGGTGAAIGAVSGAALGTAVSAAGEEHLKLPAETRLQFELRAAINIR